jgi:diguanylate cyclase (GGDEF)-like protein
MLPRPTRLALWIRHPRARHLLIAGSLVVGLMLAAVTATLIITSRHQEIGVATRELRTLALLLAEETDRGFQTGELLMVGLITSMRQDGIDSPEKFDNLMSSFAAHQDIVRRVTGLTHIDSLFLVATNGKLINSSLAWPIRNVGLADRDYVQALVADPSRVSFISMPVRNRTSGAWTILFARAFTAPDGRLIGIVSVSMDLAAFEQLFSRIAVSDDASVSLFRRDGVLLVRYPHLDPEIGKMYSVNPDFDGLLAVLDHSAVQRTSMIDGKQRLIAPHGVPHYPLIVAVTNTTDAALASWRVQTRWLASASAFTEMVLGAIVLLGVRQLRGQERMNSAYAMAIEAEAGRALAESELEMAREREQSEHAARRQSLHFDTAISNMLQGLLMFDGTGHLQVVNQRFLQLFGVPAEAVEPGMSLAALIELTVRRGTVSQDDLAALQTWRADMVSRRATANFTWELVDGRAFTVTHRPMEDGWIATYEDVTDRRNSDARIAHMARHDALTDLPNRMLFRERLDQALAYVRRGRMLALICLDLDQFKAVNDTLGHPVGDALLQAVSRRLAERIRDTDTVARLGGDEFAIIQTAIDRPSDATIFASRLIEALETPFDVAGHQIVIGTSIGIAFAPQDGVDPDVLLKNADLALYRAKLDGRGVYRLFQLEMDAEMQARRILELDLRQALRSGQLELFYQPLIDLQARSVAGFEALLRWRHPEKGLVAPSQFIPLAEEIGAIIPIGEWILQQACATAATWPDGLKVSVNLSPVQFKSRNLIQTVAAALHASGLAPERLELEITETVMLQDTDATLTTLHDLRALGVHIAMDDFGTGYSSLSYLRRFPFDRIKIDQSFIRELGKQRDCGAIVRAVIGLSRELGMATTAEGVETSDQLRALALAGCSDIQGYLFSRPVPESAILDLLRTIPTVGELLPEDGAPVARRPVIEALSV